MLFVVSYMFLSVSVVHAQGPIAQALFLGDQSLFNTTREDCVWKRGNDRDHCPDPDITMTLYPPKNSQAKIKVCFCLYSSLLHNICFGNKQKTDTVSIDTNNKIEIKLIFSGR